MSEAPKTDEELLMEDEIRAATGFFDTESLFGDSSLSSGIHDDDPDDESDD
jgi:hypothetical protein